MPFSPSQSDANSDNTVVVPWRVPHLDSDKAGTLVGVLSTQRISESGRAEVLNTIADCSAFKTNQEIIGETHLSQVMKCLDANSTEEREAAVKQLNICS